MNNLAPFSADCLLINLEHVLPTLFRNRLPRYVLLRCNLVSFARRPPTGKIRLEVEGQCPIRCSISTTQRGNSPTWGSEERRWLGTMTSSSWRLRCRRIILTHTRMEWLPTRDRPTVFWLCRWPIKAPSSTSPTGSESIFIIT